MQTDMSNAVKKQTQGHTSLPRYDIPPPPAAPSPPLLPPPTPPDEDRQFYIVDLRAQQELCVDRPVLQATVCVVRGIQELVNMMQNMRGHGDAFLLIAVHILQDYSDHCTKIYKGSYSQRPPGPTGPPA